MRRSFLRFHKTAAILTLCGLMSPIFAFAIDGKPAAKALSEDQKIVHVLNRLGFGARPGDVERVLKIGIPAYIEEQLHPERLSDTLADDRVIDLNSLTMSRSKLLEQFPDPQQLARKRGIRNPNQNK